jgi:group II intron reverse transcriptase/maturase
MEGRGRRATDALERNMADTPKPTTVSTKLQRIATLAEYYRGQALLTLAHHIDLDWLQEAYRRTRKDGATGVDGQSAEEYAAKLEANLQTLLDRAKTGTYRAPPVRRVHIPKGDGSETRPIGVPTFEDKVLQRAVAMVLEAVYEQDFYDFSYGFRPGRSAHQALEVFREQLMSMDGGWVLEVDIRGYFDAIPHAALREVLQQRVRDGVLLRLIGKWLNAGVQEEGRHWFPETGSPQGGVVSPILSNVYLHEVLDGWWVATVLPCLHGRAHLLRYADDAVMVFQKEEDARRVMAALPKRFGKYGLTLHPTKTRLVDFRRPTGTGPRPGTFDLLGFTHYWGCSRRGRWVVKRKTAKGRLNRALKAVDAWCRDHRHRPIAEQQRMLARKLRGHCEYYGITGNSGALQSYLAGLLRAWRVWLDRRSWQARMSWDRLKRLLEHYPLPPALAVHSALRHAASP